MQCWLFEDVTSWVYTVILIGLVVTDAVVSNTIPLNITTALSNDTTHYTVDTRDQRKPGDTDVNTAATWGKTTYNPETNNSNLDSPTTTLTYNTTTGPTTDGTTHHSLNLAIIPAAAVLIFLIVFCIRCCKWFRAYTRGGDKDEKNHYASILHLGDGDYGHVDVLSDSSTAYNDTVSSFCSFLKRSENTVASQRSLKGDNIRSPKRDNLNRGTKVPDSIKSERILDYRGTRNSGRNLVSSGSAMSDSLLEEGIRNMSESSEENDPFSSSFSGFADQRKLQRFRVSFTDPNRDNCDRRLLNTSKRNMNTSTSEFSPRLDAEKNLLRSNLKRGQPRLPGQPRFYSANINRPCWSEVTTPEDDEVFCVQIKTDTAACVDESQTGAVQKVSVAVQTDKSFRYSLWKRRHFSDPGREESPVFETVCEVSPTCPCPAHRSSDLSEKHISSRSCLETPTVKNSNRNHSSNSADKINEVHTNVIELSNRLICDTGSNDDVFITCDVSSIECTTSSVAGVDKIDNKSNKQNSVRRLTTNSSGDSGCPDDNRSPECTDICHLTRPNILKDIHNDNKDENNTSKCSICKATIIPEADKKSRLLFSNCDIFHICDNCNDKHDNKVKNGRLIQDMDKENVDLVKSLNTKRKDDLICQREMTSEGDELTSSLTSLESSGYAEISSESSN